MYCMSEILITSWIFLNNNKLKIKYFSIDDNKMKKGEKLTIFLLYSSCRMYLVIE